MEGADIEVEGNCKGGSALTTATIKSRQIWKRIALFVLPHTIRDEQSSNVAADGKRIAQIHLMYWSVPTIHAQASRM